MKQLVILEQIAENDMVAWTIELSARDWAVLLAKYGHDGGSFRGTIAEVLAELSDTL